MGFLGGLWGISGPSISGAAADAFADGAHPGHRIDRGRPRQRGGLVAMVTAGWS